MCVPFSTNAHSVINFNIFYANCLTPLFLWNLILCYSVESLPAHTAILTILPLIRLLKSNKTNCKKKSKNNTLLCH